MLAFVCPMQQTSFKAINEPEEQSVREVEMKRRKHESLSQISHSLYSLGRNHLQLLGSTDEQQSTI